VYLKKLVDLISAKLSIKSNQCQLLINNRIYEISDRYCILELFPFEYEILYCVLNIHC
jgi:hypothetical protein